MAFRNKWDQLKKLACCCTCSKSVQKVLRDHQYCGCKESNKLKKIMPSSDVDTSSLVDNEVVEALDYEFQTEDLEVYLNEEESAPFNHVLQTPLRPQTDIVVQGTLRDNAIRFAINFVVARDTKEDIAFHFNPRLDQHYSALNTWLNGKWGEEECNGQTKFPFQLGKPFLIEIFLTHSAFLVAVNGTHYCSYTYRTYLPNISSLQICGDVSLTRVQITDAAIYPAQLPSNFTPSPHVIPLSVPGVTNCKIQDTPVYGVLDCRLEEKCNIEINGRLHLLPHSFYINLQEGCREWPRPEVPLQLSFRFNQRGVRQIVMINSWHSDGEVGEVETLPPTKFLFTPGCPFKVVIVCQSDAFVIRVGEKTISTYRHRVPYTVVNTVHIHGDIFVYDISLSL